MTNDVVSELKGVKVYQYDLITHSYDKVVDNQRPIASLRLLIENIMRNSSKCSFCVSSLEFFEYVVDSNSFKPDIKRLALLTNAQSQKILHNHVH